jgi:hypothetical protein
MYRRPNSSKARLLNRFYARRNALARAVREAGGLFRGRVRFSSRRYRRHDKHRQRALADLLAWQR